jgi:outer membrane murein-binding lipoprotein Lpp
MNLTNIGRLAALILASTILAGCNSVKPVRVQASYKNVTIALDLEI